MKIREEEVDFFFWILGEWLLGNLERDLMVRVLVCHHKK